MARREFERSVHLALERTALRPRRITAEADRTKPASEASGLTICVQPMVRYPGSL
jgi:hypothetical protein